MPEMVCASKVNVTVGVSVAGKVIASVNGTGLGAPVADVAVEVIVAVAVTMTVPLTGVVEVANEGVEVFEGRGLLVVVAVRLGGKDGSGAG